MKDSPTKRTLKWFREAGWNCHVVEHWNAFARVRQDLFGFIDIVCVKDGRPVTGIQCTTRQNLLSREEKAFARDEFYLWLKGGGTIYFFGWKLSSPKGVKAKRWCALIHEYDYEHGKIMLRSYELTYSGQLETTGKASEVKPDKEMYADKAEQAKERKKEQSEDTGASGHASAGHVGESSGDLFGGIG